MDLNLAFFAVVVYLGVYIVVIDRVAAEVDRVDPSYRKYTNAPAAGYFSRSLFAATLLLDRHMPKRQYVFGLRAKLHLARAMLGSAPLLFLILLMI